MSDHREAFAEAIREAGLNPPDAIVDDGELHRFATNGRADDDSGWYVLHGDEHPAGAFGDWRSGVEEKWSARNGHSETPEERKARAERIAQAKRKAAEERERRHAEAAEKALKIWEAADEARPDHPYLKRKQIAPSGLRTYRGSLVVPVKKNGALVSLQFIDENGEKRFLAGGETAGASVGIGNPDGADRVLIAEGFATGRSLNSATSDPVICAFNAGNMVKVAGELPARFPGAEVIVCADDDYETPGNPGVTKAREAAASIGAKVAIPRWSDTRPEGATDFNDLCNSEGVDAVVQAINSAEDVQASAESKHGEQDRISSPPARAVAERILEVARQRTHTLNPREYELNESDNGRLLVDLTIGWLKYNATDQCFMLWTGTRWTPDQWRIVPAIADIVGRLRHRWMGEVSPDRIKEATAFVTKTRSARGNRATLYFAAADPRIASVISEYDTDGDLLNTPGGTVDLRTGKLRPHDPADMITKITPVTPDWQHIDELWRETLYDATCKREDLEGALQRIIGSGVVGRANKDKIAINYGLGANLKGTIIETARRVAGDYAASVSIKTLMRDDRASGHSEDLARLRGVRMGVSNEIGVTGYLDEERLKELSGGDTVTASHKYGRAFDFRPTATFIISTNHKPGVVGTDDGVWRRLWLFPFEHVVPPEIRDPAFKDRLFDEEGPAVLAWVVDGARQFIAEGWGAWPTVEAATADYRAREDKIGMFVAECCDVVSGAQAQAGKLRKRYEKWCDENGETPFQGASFRKALEERGHPRKELRMGNVYENLRLRAEGME